MASDLPNGGGFYLLPDDANTVTHVNANDLVGGTARIGPAWAMTGLVPFNNAGLGTAVIPTVGPFNDTNYFSQTSSPANIGSSPFVLVVICTAKPSGVPFNTGAYPVSGYSAQWEGETAQFVIGSGADNTVNTATPGQLSVFMMGADGAGTAWVQLNDGTPVTNPCAQASGGGLALIGRYSSTGSSYAGNIAEILVSTDVPSAALFTAIYNYVKAQFANANRYVIPATANVVTHVSGVDLNAGTAKTGGAWTKEGTIPFNVGDDPVPSVGPLTDSSYFGQTLLSPANVGTGPFTVAMIVNPVSISDNVFFSTGQFSSGGYYLILEGVFGFTTNTLGTSYSIATANSAVAGAVNILIAGMDASGHTFAQLNGGAVVTASGASIAASGSNTYIGRYTSAGQASAGNVIELMVSTDVPSSAAFTALYNAIVANGG